MITDIFAYIGLAATLFGVLWAIVRLIELREKSVYEQEMAKYELKSLRLHVDFLTSRSTAQAEQLRKLEMRKKK